MTSSMPANSQCCGPRVRRDVCSRCRRPLVLEYPPPASSCLVVSIHTARRKMNESSDAVFAAPVEASSACRLRSPSNTESNPMNELFRRNERRWRPLIRAARQRLRQVMLKGQDAMVPALIARQTGNPPMLARPAANAAPTYPDAPVIKKPGAMGPAPNSKGAFAARRRRRRCSGYPSGSRSLVDR